MSDDDKALVQRVIGIIADHNHPHTDDDMPYPWSLRGMAVAVIAAVREHDAARDEAAHAEVEAELAAEADGVNY